MPSAPSDVDARPRRGSCDDTGYKYSGWYAWAAATADVGPPVSSPLKNSWALLSSSCAAAGVDLEERPHPIARPKDEARCSSFLPTSTSSKSQTSAAG